MAALDERGIEDQQSQLKGASRFRGNDGQAVPPLHKPGSKEECP
ncbi:hypothetical protein ACFWZ1_11585 [Frateuria sp. GZRe14]|jgi:hypothetical protein|nr:hypothetical protein [Frateuria edaphi]